MFWFRSAQTKQFWTSPRWLELSLGQRELLLSRKAVSTSSQQGCTAGQGKRQLASACLALRWSTCEQCALQSAHKAAPCQVRQGSIRSARGHVCSASAGARYTHLRVPSLSSNENIAVPVDLQRRQQQTLTCAPRKHQPPGVPVPEHSCHAPAAAWPAVHGVHHHK